MTSNRPIVVLGSGLAGYTFVREFRKLNKDKPIVMVTADDGHFYSKPNLSNAFAQKKTADSLVSTHADKMRNDLNIDIRAHATASKIDTKNKRILVNENWIEYANLILAIGAKPRKLDDSVDPNHFALSVNSLSDFRVYENRVANAKHVTIIGSGLIGCEFANDLIQAGKQVALIGTSALPVQPLLPNISAQDLKNGLERAGVKTHMATGVEKIEKTSNTLQVKLKNGSTVTTDLVISAIGLIANTELAQQAEIKTRNGIVVNDLLQTNDPHIYATGDCVEFQGRVQPFVMPIMNQARALAKTLNGEPTPLIYPLMPVVIKTPACSVVVLPPPSNIDGKWSESSEEAGTKAIFIDQNGATRGFALTGKLTSERQNLLKLCS